MAGGCGGGWLVVAGWWWRELSEIIEIVLFVYDIRNSRAIVHFILSLSRRVLCGLLHGQCVCVWLIVYITALSSNGTQQAHSHFNLVILWCLEWCR